jgi:VWFA-related protein
MSARDGALAAITLLALAALAVRPAAQQAPVFKIGVDLVPVTFLAVAEDGRPIPDLKPHEVSIRVDNRERTIASLEFVRLAGAAIGGSPVPRPLPAPFGSNRLLDAGRTVLIVVAHESISAGKERPAREAASRFLSRLSPRDRVGVVLIPRGRVDVDLTTDHERVAAALGRIVGQAPENPSESDRLCRSRLTLQGTADLLRSLTAIDGPKTVVFISSGLMPPKRDGPLTASRTNWAPGYCELVTQDYDAVGVSAGLARATFYVIQPEDLRVDSGRPPTDSMGRVQSGGPPDPGRRAFEDPSVSRFATSDDELNGLQNLTGVTGGEIFRLMTTAPDDVFARVARESAGYYVATFEPDAGERTGQPHHLAVRALRNHVTVRSGSQVLIARADGPVAPTPQTVLRDPQVRRELPLRVTAYSARDPSGSGVRILAVAEPVDPAVRLTGAAFGVFGAEGRLVARSTSTADDLRTRPLLAAIPVEAGAYRVRVAATDALGRAGSADFELDARLIAAGPLAASGLALGVARAGSFEPRMEFAGDAAAVVYLELYGSVPRRDALTVTVEIGETLAGPPLGSMPARVSQPDDTNRQVVTAFIPIGGLLPGDFVVRAVVSIGGKPVGSVVRTLRKAGPQP